MTEKRCSKCGETKPVSEFARDATKANGVKSWCKACDTEKGKAYYAANRDRKRAYYQANKDKPRARYAMHRARAIEIYGGCCETCGSTEQLEFDHVDWDGGEHRRVEGHHTMLRRIAVGGVRIADRRLQLLCQECHKVRPHADVELTANMVRMLQMALREVQRLEAALGKTEQGPIT